MRVESLREKYLEKVFGLADPELSSVRERMRVAGKIDRSLSTSEARILSFFIRGFGVKKIVEFGTLYGFSALAMAKALPADGLLITLESDPRHHTEAAETFRGDKRIESWCGDARDLMPAVTARGPFDLVFIDANKSGYVEYLDWAEANVRIGGLIVGDNTFLWGGVYDSAERENLSEKQIQVMKLFNARLADPAKYNSMLIPTAQGLTVAQKLRPELGAK